MTAPAHPVVFRPIIRLLRDAGHEVEVTARDYAQTIPLLKRMGIDHVAVGRHGGASRARKLQALAGRTWKMRRFAKGRFDLAVAHGSNDLALAAASLRIPAVNTFDYEFAVQQHNIGCRLARRVMTPDAIPPERLERFGVGPGKLVQYAGLKEEYYLSDFTPDPARAGGTRGGPGEDRRDRAPAAGRLALPPQVQPPVPARARAPRPPRGRLRRRDPAHRRPARARAAARAAVGDRARAGGRRPEPDRARRPRRVGRRDDEPRGGRARHPGLHDLRRAARRRRRAPDPRRPAAPADRRARDRDRQAARQARDRAPRSRRPGGDDPGSGRSERDRGTDDRSPLPRDAGRPLRADVAHVRAAGRRPRVPHARHRARRRRARRSPRR